MTPSLRKPIRANGAAALAFAGSHVRVPLDLDPGMLDPGSLDCTLDYGPSAGVAALRCEQRPVVEKDAEMTSPLDGSPGQAVVAVLDAARVPVPVLGAGELASPAFAVRPAAVGATVPVCIDPGAVRIGSGRGPGLCVGRVCLIARFFDPSLGDGCGCDDCNRSGELNAADAPCITQCTFGECVTSRR